MAQISVRSLIEAPKGRQSGEGKEIMWIALVCVGAVAILTQIWLGIRAYRRVMHASTACMQALSRMHIVLADMQYMYTQERKEKKEC